MATATKGKKKTRTIQTVEGVPEDAGPAAGGEAQELTNVDRYAAVEILRAGVPHVIAEACKLPFGACANYLREQLVTNRVGGAFHAAPPGEPAIWARLDGLEVEHQGRSGVVTWLWLEDELAEADGLDEMSNSSELDEDVAATGGTAPALLMVSVAVDLIDVAENDRQAFDQAELEELAETFRTHGILQPLLVQNAFDRYRLVAGERRLRAAKLAGLKTVPAQVATGDVDAAWIARARLIENEQRKDLSAIEKAGAFQKQIEAGGLTHEAFAQSIGKTQAYVTNHLRLLKLPKKWQQRVISGEMPSGHARALVKYAEIPEVLKEAEETFFDKDSWLREPLGNDQDFAATLKEIAGHVTMPMEGKEWEYVVGREVPIFKPSDEEREKLQVIELDGKPRALNTKLWDSLRKKQLAELVKEKEAKAKKGQKADAGDEPTAAQQKAAAKKQAQQFAKRLDEWRTNWLRWILHRVVLENARVGLAAVVMQISSTARIEPDRIGELVHLEGKAKRGYSVSSDALLAAIAGHAQPVELLIQFASDWLWEGDEPRNQFFAPELEALAVAAGVDLEAEWRKELAGPLSEAYFNLHSKAQLVELAEELGIVEISERLPKGGIVEALLHTDVKVVGETLPEEVKRLPAGSKKTPATKKKKGKPARKPAARKK